MKVALTYANLKKYHKEVAQKSNSVLFFISLLVSLTKTAFGSENSPGKFSEFSPFACKNKVLLPNGTWSATASATGAGNAAYIVDGSFSNDGWVSSTPVAGTYIIIDFASSVDLAGFIYYPKTFAAAYQDINSYTIEYSNDGVNFMLIQTSSLIQQSYFSGTTGGTGRPAIVEFGNIFNARFIKLTINSTYQGNAASIAELLPIVCQTTVYAERNCVNANLLNTGTNATGTAKSSTGVFDRNWEVAWIGNNTAATYSTVSNSLFLPAVVVTKAGAWSASPYNNAEWIAYTPSTGDGITTTGTPNDYFFRYTFIISDIYQLGAFKLKLNFMADNEVQNVYINGVGQAPQTKLPQANNNYNYIGYTLVNQAQTILKNNFQIGINEIVVHVKSFPGAAGFLGQNITSCNGLDLGDAAASYKTIKEDNGPGHIIEVNTSAVITLKMGSTVDAESDGQISVNATGDDFSGIDDEDGVTAPTIQIDSCRVISYAVTVTATNITGLTANLLGWIDWDGNGTFDPYEGVSTTVPTGANNLSKQLIWNNVVAGIPNNASSITARFRISTDALTVNTAGGTASDGEVEDYTIPVTWTNYDFGNLTPSKWPAASATTVATDRVWLGPDFPSVECTTDINDTEDGLTITDAPSGSGTKNNPWILNGTGSIYNFQLTVNGNGMPKTVYWGLWFDVNGNGIFNDATDIFLTGNLLHGSPISTNFNVTIPNGNGETSGNIRVIATATNPGFTTSMNGSGVFINGEVEDYYISYTTALPLRLTVFKVDHNNHEDKLTWTTGSEQNVSHFDIEYSNNEQNFKSVGIVSAIGNSTAPQTYYFIYSNIRGIHFYRLKVCDKDGKFEYSKIIKVTGNDSPEVKFFPNPVRKEITVTGLKRNDILNVYTVSGCPILTLRIKNPTEIINMSNLFDGIYIVKVTSANNNAQIFRVIKH